jgi:hypothetical protein
VEFAGIGFLGSVLRIGDLAEGDLAENQQKKQLLHRRWVPSLRWQPVYAG